MPTFDPQLPRNIDATQRSCFVSCPQKFYKEFVFGLRPPGLSIDLHAGACFAAALEETYRGIYMHSLTLSQALERAHARFCVEWGDFQIPSYKRSAKTMDRVWTAIAGGESADDRGYFQEYPPHTDPVKPFLQADGTPTMEYTFDIPLEPYTAECNHNSLGAQKAFDAGHFPCHPSGQPFHYCGRFDMLGQHRGGIPIPRDEKTTGSSISESWKDKWKLRSQFIGYVWALQRCGLPATEICVRGVGILKTKIAHAESYQPYSQELISRWYEQLRRDMWRLRRAWDSGVWDFDFAEACTQYGNCIFLDSCTSRDPLQWLNEMEVRRWDPLHKNPAAVADPSKASAT
jgi:hypothetical protein